MVEHFAVRGGARLVGSVDVVGAKNSVLKLMAAALLAEGTTTITNCPEILDVPLMADVLRSLGCTVAVDHDTVTIDVPAEPGAQADYRSVSKLRASVCVLGPLVARCRRAVVPLPGGDAIGSRPLDMHQAGLRKLGATTEIEHGRVVAEAGDLHGAQIWLDFPSVGATENILMAAVLAEGTTVIDNAAREPEIVDLCTMLQQMGAKIEGVGQLDADRARCHQPAAHRAPRDRRPHRRRHVGVRRGDDAGDGRRPRRRPAPPRPGARQAAHGRRGRHVGLEEFTVAMSAGRGPSTSSRCPTRGSPRTCSRWRSRWPRWPTARR